MSPSLSVFCAQLSTYLWDSVCINNLSFCCPRLAAGCNFSLPHVLGRATSLSLTEFGWKLEGGHWEGRGSHPSATWGASNAHNVLQYWRALNSCWRNSVSSRNALQFVSRMGISMLHQHPQWSLPLNGAALRPCTEWLHIACSWRLDYWHKPCVTLFHCALHGHGHAAREYPLTLHIIQHTHNAMLWDLSSMFKVSNRMHTGDCSSARAQGQTPWSHAWRSLPLLCSEHDLLVVTCLLGWVLALPPWWCMVVVSPSAEANGPQAEGERMCGPDGGHTHLSVNATILQVCLKKVAWKEWRRLKEECEKGGSCNSSFIPRLTFPRARPVATVLPKTEDRLSCQESNKNWQC